MIRRMMMASLNSSTSPPSDTYELTIVINGLDDEYEVAVNNEVWPDNKKSFAAGTILQNLVVTVVGYDIDPPIVSEVIMDADKTLTFEATPASHEFIQSSKIMFTSDGQYREDTNWNTVDQGVTNGDLINNTGQNIAWKISVPAMDDWDIDPEVSNPGFGDFTSVSLSRVVYTYVSGDNKIITLSSLDNTKSYKVRIGALTGYDDPNGDMKTNVTINGVTKVLENALGFTLYEVVFENISGVNNIVIDISNAPGGTYATICAMILEEYTN